MYTIVLWSPLWLYKPLRSSRETVLQRRQDVGSRHEVVTQSLELSDGGVALARLDTAHCSMLQTTINHARLQKTTPHTEPKWAALYDDPSGKVPFVRACERRGRSTFAAPRDVCSYG